MRKVLHIAIREFLATVLTKGFLFGVLVMPLLAMTLIPLATMLISQKPPAVKGTIAIIDRSGGDPGRVATLLRERLTPEAFADDLRERTAEAMEQVSKKLEQTVGSEQAKQAAPFMGMAAAKASDNAPQITPELLSPNLDDDALNAEKEKLLTGTNFDGSRLALLVISPDAVELPAGAEKYGTYELFLKGKLDVRVQSLLRRQVRDAIIEARIRASGDDPARVRRLTSFDAPEARTWTRSGEKSGGEAQQFLVPLAFMMLLWISVFTGGQFLLTSLIEEKSNRIMEVLLSAVSPMQLMTGKIVGQMCAGLLILVLYSGLGISALFVFRQMHLIETANIIYLAIFFFLAFAMIASMMAAVGSAVDDIHEAQTLLTPMMLIVMAPMFLMMPIIMNPKSVLATVMSFVPPVNPFVMVMRLASNDPPPVWQVWLSIAVGLLGVYIMATLAAKVFRIGVLMYGKPPDFRTLIKWMRMA